MIAFICVIVFVYGIIFDSFKMSFAVPVLFQSLKHVVFELDLWVALVPGFVRSLPELPLLILRPTHTDEICHV